jgi:DNA primase
VVLLYDSDRAGLKATFRAGDELLRAGVEVLVATLPDGEDPDSLVRAQGAKGLQRYLDDAVDVFERKVQILERRGFFTSIAGTRKAIDALLPTIRAAADEVLRSVYVGRVAEKAKVTREALEREIAEAPQDFRGALARRAAERRREGEGPQPRSEVRYAQSAPPPSPAAARRIGPERNLILVLLLDEGRVERAAAEVEDDEITDPDYRTIFRTIKEIEVEGGRDADGIWRTLFPAHVQPLVEELCGTPAEEYTSAPEEFFESSLRRLKSTALERRLRAMEERLERAGDEPAPELVQEYTQMLRAVREQGLRYKGKAMFLTLRDRRG